MLPRNLLAQVSCSKAAFPLLFFFFFVKGRALLTHTPNERAETPERDPRDKRGYGVSTRAVPQRHRLDRVELTHVRGRRDDTLP